MERIEFTPNKSKRTFTIRKYDENGKLIAKYRSYPQDNENFNYYSNYATENDKKQFLKSNDYYVVR